MISQKIYIIMKFLLWFVRVKKQMENISIFWHVNKLIVTTNMKQCGVKHKFIMEWLEWWWHIIYTIKKDAWLANCAIHLFQA
jgi:hypothetical protein